MAAPSSPGIIFVPGRLIWNPTDLGQAEPYGGTYLGTCRSVRFTPHPKYRDIWGEEVGSVTDSIYCGEGPCEMTAVVRYPDDDMLLTAAPKAVSSGSSGVHWLFRPGGTTTNTRAGTSGYASAGKLLFAPKAVNAHPMILMYSAIPQILGDAELFMNMKDEWGLAVRFVGTPDSSGRVYDCGRRANLVL